MVRSGYPATETYIVYSGLTWKRHWNLYVVDTVNETFVILFVLDQNDFYFFALHSPWQKIDFYFALKSNLDL